MGSMSSLKNATFSPSSLVVIVLPPGWRVWNEKGGELANRAATGYLRREEREISVGCYRACWLDMLRV